jgi:catechol 2,3-dioxygenase-like lactoylglutathione lyase family enzyme
MLESVPRGHTKKAEIVPRTKVAGIAYVIYRHPDLDRIESFLTDFGLTRAARDEKTLYMRGNGPEHHLYVAERGANSEFVGYALRADTRTDLDILAKAPGASPVEALDGPAGGVRVRMHDPNGFRIDVVHGMAEIDPLPTRPPMAWNDVREKRRTGTPQRPPVERAAVQRLGHIGLKVIDVEATFRWYTLNFGLRASDIRYAATPEHRIGVFLRCDRGEEWVDHHTIVIFRGEPPRLHHVSFEVVDFDALRLGHDWMEKQGWGPSWGVGRHILGSQVFDYWCDPWGNVVEHFTDGDMLQRETPAGTQKAGPGQNAVWGPPRPDWMNR